MVEQKISDAIKISGVISILLVICIHYNTQNVAVNPIDLFIQKVLQDGIGRAAVPLFAFFFGFFYFKDSNSIKLFYLHSLKKRFHSIFIPYIIASFIFYIFYTLKEFHGDVQAIPTVKSIFYDILIYPKSSQLWFVRDLMVLSLLSPLFSVNSNVINYTLGLVLFILWFFQVQFTPIIGWYILSIEMAFFYWVGVCFYKNKLIEKFVFTKSYLFIAISMIWLLLCCARVLIEPNFNIWYSENYTITALIVQKSQIILGAIVIFNLSFYIKSKFSLNIASFTFFIYLYHLFPISFLVKKVTSFMGEYSFFPSVLIVLLLMSFIAYFMKKYFNRLYVLLSGGR